MYTKWVARFAPRVVAVRVSVARWAAGIQATTDTPADLSAVAPQVSGSQATRLG